ncbi:hypothetical protein [Roseovarius amoyensis]|nr:hypothetical protein [Roseovarius amoyensis]
MEKALLPVAPVGRLHVAGLLAQNNIADRPHEIRRSARVAK